MKPIKKQRNPKPMMQAAHTLTGTYAKADDTSRAARRRKVDANLPPVEDKLSSRKSRYEFGKRVEEEDNGS